MSLFRGILVSCLLPAAAFAQTVASSVPLTSFVAPRPFAGGKVPRPAAARPSPRPLAPPTAPALPVLITNPTSVVSVRTARMAQLGTTLTVRGIVLNGPELGPVRYLQDGSARGLALHGATVPGFARLSEGDSVEVRGKLRNHRGLLTLDPVFQVQLLGGKRPVRALRVPAARAAAALTEANEGRLLRITGVSRLSAAGPAAETGLALNPETTYLLDGRPGAAVRISAGSTGPEGMAEQRCPTGAPFDVLGVVSRADAGRTTGPGSYFLLLRQRGDFRRAGGLPRLREEPVPTVVTPTSLTIVYETLNVGDTRLSYGTNPAQLRAAPRQAALTTQHSVTLENLRPATSYYIEVSSANETGLVKSPPVIMITGQLK